MAADEKFGTDHDGLARVCAWSAMGASFYAAQAVTMIADRLHQRKVLTNADIDQLKLAMTPWIANDHAWRDVIKADTAQSILDWLDKIASRKE